MKNRKWLYGAAAILLTFLGGVWVGRAALPNQLKSARMTSATTVAQTPNKMAELETAIADILGIPIDTNISAALFTVDASGLKKVNLKDFAGAPTAAGELLRNGAVLQFYDGTTAQTLATRAGTETLTNKTLSYTNNVIDADTAQALAANGANCSAGNAPLGVDAAGAVEGCFDVATQAELNTHDTATTGIHGMGASTVVGTNLTQTLTNKTISGANNTISATTATALSANGTNCAANQAAAGVDASGNAEGCFDVGTAADIATHVASTAAHGATGANVGTTNTQTLSAKSISGALTFLDNAADPTTTGQLVRNGIYMKYYDGSNSRALVTEDTSQTLFNKTIHYSNNAIDADTALALSANGTNCSAGSAPLGVDASGNAEGCFDVATQTELDNHTGQTAAHGASGAVVGTTNSQTLTNKTLSTGSIVANAASIRDSTDVFTISRPALSGTDTLVTLGATQTLTNKTISGASNTLSNIANSSLKSTTGTFGASTNSGVAMNDYSFFPNLDIDTCTGVTTWTMGGQSSLDQTNDTVGRWRSILDTSCTTGTYQIRWRYLTASRDPEIILGIRISNGQVVAIWRSEIEHDTIVPITFEDSDIEAVYLADFPAEWLTVDAGQIIANINNATTPLGTIARSGASKDALIATAQSHGRVVITSLPMVGVQ